MDRSSSARSPISFKGSAAPTVGIEIELGLVDAQTMALRSANEAILAKMPPALAESIKPELMQCYVEINSSICRTIDDADLDLRRKLRVLQQAADELGLRLLWSATHPFSSWREQRITPNERYLGLVNLMQDTARQLVTFGLHVHVGVDSGGKAIMICDRILEHLPTLLAASANSPFWDGRPTGMHSYRSRIMDSLPTAGLPPIMRNWSEYVWLVNHLIETGYIETIREIWWDVRPHHNFGTVEVRICDLPGSLEDALALAALIQCLVKMLSDQIDRGTYQNDRHPLMVRQNKWRAARYGLDAQLVSFATHKLEPARQVLAQLVETLQPVAEELGCPVQLQRIRQIAAKPTWAEQQMEIWKATGDPAEVVRRFTDRSRV